MDTYMNVIVADIERVERLRQAAWFSRLHWDSQPAERRAIRLPRPAWPLRWPRPRVGGHTPAGAAD